ATSAALSALPPSDPAALQPTRPAANATPASTRVTVFMTVTVWRDSAETRAVTESPQNCCRPVAGALWLRCQGRETLDVLATGPHCRPGSSGQRCAMAHS